MSLLKTGAKGNNGKVNLENRALPALSKGREEGIKSLLRNDDHRSRNPRRDEYRKTQEWRSQDTIGQGREMKRKNIEGQICPPHRMFLRRDRKGCNKKGRNRARGGRK